VEALCHCNKQGNGIEPVFLNTNPSKYSSLYAKTNPQEECSPLETHLRVWRLSFHDKVVHVGGAEAPEARPVCNLSLQEFQFCSTCNCLSEIPKGLPPDDDAPARLIGTPTLREAFDVLPADVGVDVTVKVTTCPATTTCQEIDRVLTPVLEDVAEEIGRRTVACSAYDIDACIEMRRRMPDLPVLLRSTADEEASDGRRISPGQAVKLASSHGLTGIVVDSGELSPQLVGEAKPHGLYVLAQGGSGGDPEWVSRQKRLGADGVIASDAGAALEVVAPLREQQQQPS